LNAHFCKVDFVLNKEIPVYKQGETFQPNSIQVSKP